MADLGLPPHLHQGRCARDLFGLTPMTVMQQYLTGAESRRDRLAVRLAAPVSPLRKGRVLHTWRAVVGKPGTPTLRGLYAIYEWVRQLSPNDFLGTWP